MTDQIFPKKIRFMSYDKIIPILATNPKLIQEVLCSFVNPHIDMKSNLKCKHESFKYFTQRPQFITESTLQIETAEYSKDKSINMQVFFKTPIVMGLSIKEV